MLSSKRRVPDITQIRDIRRVFATDARRVKALRLEALSDPVAGIAFIDTLAGALAQPDQFWTDRTVAAALSTQAAQFVAEEGGEWSGTVTVLVKDRGRALLVGVYVRPQSRGSGILSEIIDAAENWAHRQECTTLLLEVHEDNVRAQAAYRKVGFAVTGHTVDGPNGRELEMVRPIPSAV